MMMMMMIMMMAMIVFQIRRLCELTRESIRMHVRTRVVVATKLSRPANVCGTTRTAASRAVESHNNNNNNNKCPSSTTQCAVAAGNVVDDTPNYFRVCRPAPTVNRLRQIPMAPPRF